MVTVSSNPQPGSRVQLDIEVPAPEVDRHFGVRRKYAPSPGLSRKAALSVWEEDQHA